MWWINSICQLVSTFVLVSMVFCYARKGKYRTFEIGFRA